MNTAFPPVALLVAFRDRRPVPARSPESGRSVSDRHANVRREIRHFADAGFRLAALDKAVCRVLDEDHVADRIAAADLGITSRCRAWRIIVGIDRSCSGRPNVLERLNNGYRVDRTAL